MSTRAVVVTRQDSITRPPSSCGMSAKAPPWGRLKARVENNNHRFEVIVALGLARVLACVGTG